MRKGAGKPIKGPQNPSHRAKSGLCCSISQASLELRAVRGSDLAPLCL